MTVKPGNMKRLMPTAEVLQALRERGCGKPAGIACPKCGRCEPCEPCEYFLDGCPMVRTKIVWHEEEP